MAGDQCVATGYAVDLPGKNYLPVEHWLAWRLSRPLRNLRDEDPGLRLGPDRKLLVGLAHDGDRRRLKEVQ